MIIAIDFDGTIVEHEYPEIGSLLPNAKRVINRLYNEGHEIIIWTVRSGTYNAIQAAVDFLHREGIQFTKVNQDSHQILNNPAWIDYSRKIYADIYIDDRSVPAPPRNWEEIYTLIQERIRR